MLSIAVAWSGFSACPLLQPQKASLTDRFLLLAHIHACALTRAVNHRRKSGLPQTTPRSNPASPLHLNRRVSSLALGGQIKLEIVDEFDCLPI